MGGRGAGSGPKYAAGVSRGTLGSVVVLGDADAASGHEAVSRREIARRLAGLLGYDFAGEYDASARYPGRVYFVPNDTLVGIAAARALGIRGESDLFGGVVPHAFVATKTITHPLVAAGARAPEGWSAGFCEQVRGSVLAGYSAFSLADARRAGERLLREGPVRIKPALGIGGRGQRVAGAPEVLESQLAALDPDALARHGVVIEQDLAEVVTYSVGRVQVGGLLLTYWGTQKITPSNRGEAVYGGSELTVARGDFDALLRLGPPPETALAVQQALVYDAAAGAHFGGLLASRRNYDVACGLDAQGRRRCGVLEQSWRVGGSSGAEVGALEALRADAGLAALRAGCTEIYGESPAPPPGAVVYFRGVDARAGPITKYTLVEPYAHP